MESEPKKEQGLSFEEQTNLAKAVYDAADARNEFTERLGGFDDFAAVHQHVDNNRAKYDALAKTFEDARKKFDETVTDKKALVEYLQGIGEKNLADRIKRMFSV